MSCPEFKIALTAGSLFLAACAAQAADGGNFPPVSETDFRLAQYGGGGDPRYTCQNAAGDNWHIPQKNVQVSEGRPVGPGVFAMTVWAQGLSATCTADDHGRVRSFVDQGGGNGPGPGPAPGYGPGPGGPAPGYGGSPAPGYGSGPAPAYGGGRTDPRNVCQDAAGKYWHVPQKKIGVGEIRPLQGGAIQVTVVFGGRAGICVVDPGGRLLSFNDR